MQRECNKLPRLDAYKAALRRCPLGLVLSKDGPRPLLGPRTRGARGSVQSRRCRVSPAPDLMGLKWGCCSSGTFWKSQSWTSGARRHAQPCHQAAPVNTPFKRPVSVSRTQTFLSPLHLNALAPSRSAKNKFMLLLFYIGTRVLIIL